MKRIVPRKTKTKTLGSRQRAEPKFARGGRPAPRKKICRFCTERIYDIDYKDVYRLQRMVTERGKILAARITGTCAGHQRQLTRSIKRARYLALLPFVVE